jgi:hypothetical protein
MPARSAATRSFSESPTLGMASKLSSYAAIVDQVAVLEVSGGVDIPRLVSFVGEELTT